MLVKCLNMILLHKTDPFLAKKHNEYLEFMRKKRNEAKAQTFYQRMQQDIKLREIHKQEWTAAAAAAAASSQINHDKSVLSFSGTHASQVSHQRGSGIQQRLTMGLGGF